MLAYLVAIVCVIVAVMYYMVPGGLLLTFMPGYDDGSTHIHTMQAVADRHSSHCFFVDRPLYQAVTPIAVPLTVHT